MDYAKILDDGGIDIRYCHENDKTRMAELMNVGFMPFVPSECPATDAVYIAVDTFTIRDGKVVQLWETTVDPSAIVGQIESLKAELAASDYQVTKCMEAQLCGEPLPYDIDAIHAQRNAMRAEINRLEALIG